MIKKSDGPIISKLDSNNPTDEFDSTLTREIGSLKQLLETHQHDETKGTSLGLTGNACFLTDGRVLCQERERGVSRYPYGRDGFNFWVYSSGIMHCNDGLFFVFLPPQEGAEPPVAFFAGTRKNNNDPFEPLSLLPTPFLNREDHVPIRRHTIIGHDATYFITETPDLETTVRVFVDQTKGRNAQVAFSIHLRNTGNSNLQMYTSAYMNPLCRHQFVETNEDRWFKKISTDHACFNEIGTLPPFTIAVNEDVSRFQSVTNYAVVRRHAQYARQSNSPADFTSSACTSRLAYTGSPRRTLSSASFLTTGVFEHRVPLTVFNDNAVVGDLCRFTLPPNDAIRLDYLLSIPDGEKQLARTLSEQINPAELDKTRARLFTQAHCRDQSLKIQVNNCRFPGLNDDTFNHFLSYLKTQVAVCAQMKGFMHASPNSLIGIRDVFQAIEGHLYYEPDLAKEKIREALHYVLITGQCPRQYSLPVSGSPGKSDMREFIDQGVWVISTLYTYLCVTGDIAFLDETIGYHQVDPNDDSAIEPAEAKDSVLEHLMRIMNYLDENRCNETGLLRALYGDWNDALDGLGTCDDPDEEFGSGVSIMATLQLYQNCTEMLEILERFYPGRYRDKTQRYKLIREELRQGLLRYGVVSQGNEKRIVHGWGDARGYYVGSFEDSDGLARDGLTSNAFWVTSGMIKESSNLHKNVLDAFDRLDSPFGLKTFEPGFQPNAPGVGRIPKLPVGTAENGATYIHATVFGIMALFELGEPKRAWEQIYKILPFSPHQKGISHSPFVMPNSYVHNPDLNLSGQNMNDWQTGSSNALLKTLIKHAFGFCPEFDNLRIAPAMWFPLSGFDFQAITHDRKVNITLSQGDVKERQFLFNSKAIPSAMDEYSNIPYIRIPYVQLADDRENVIQIIDPKQ